MTGSGLFAEVLYPVLLKQTSGILGLLLIVKQKPSQTQKVLDSIRLIQL